MHYAQTKRAEQKMNVIRLEISNGISRCGHTFPLNNDEKRSVTKEMHNNHRVKPLCGKTIDEKPTSVEIHISVQQK